LPKAFQSRWPHIFLAVLALTALSPSAVFIPLSENVRATNQALSKNKWITALDSLEAAIDLEPALWSEHLLAASIALRSEDAERALLHLELENPLPPGSGISCLEAQAEIMQNEIHRAEQAWQKANGSCPDKAGYYQALLRHYWNRHDLTTARSVLEEWIEFGGDDPRAYLQLGILLAVLQPEDAMDPLRRAQQLSEEPIPLASALIRAIEDTRGADLPAYTLASVGQALTRYNEWTPAVWAFEEALVHDPEYAQAHAYLGLALDKSGKDGFEHLQTAVSEQPQNPLVYIFFAYHWRMKEQPTIAKIYLEIAARLEPTNPAISAELAQVYADLGDLEAAKDTLRFSITLAPEDAQFWFLMARFSIERGIEIQTLGLPAARNAMLLDRENPDGLVLLGYAHLTLRNFDLAERLLWRAVQMNPGLAQTQYYFGLLRRMQGDTERARAAWEYTQLLDPDGAFGELAGRMIQTLQYSP
jgi:tetratricopeptide (TPR) repeat protein